MCETERQTERQTVCFPGVMRLLSFTETTQARGDFSLRERFRIHKHTALLQWHGHVFRLLNDPIFKSTRKLP